MEDDKVAHHKDAIKKIRQDEKRNLRNKMVRTNYRNRIRELRAAIDAGDKAGAEKLLKPTLAAVDRALAKGELKLNTASRYKSRLTVAVAKLGSVKAA